MSLTNKQPRYGTSVRSDDTGVRSSDVGGRPDDLGRDAVRVWTGDLSERTFYDRYGDEQLEAFITTGGAAGGERP